MGLGVIWAVMRRQRIKDRGHHLPHQTPAQGAMLAVVVAVQQAPGRRAVEQVAAGAQVYAIQEIRETTVLQVLLSQPLETLVTPVGAEAGISHLQALHAQAQTVLANQQQPLELVVVAGGAGSILALLVLAVVAVVEAR